jgi:hypothetical protein
VIERRDLDKWKQPTDGQKQAGNYFKPRIAAAGIEIAIENPLGTIRSGTNSDGSDWKVTMTNHYGYVVGSTGADGDEVDVYVGTNPDSEEVFIIRQAVYGDWDKVDEDKVMLFFNSEQEATEAYLRHYSDKRFLHSLITMDMEKFKKKIFTHEGKIIKSVFDIQQLNHECENRLYEYIGKSLSEDSHDIWKPHENEFISEMVELFTERGLLRVDAVKEELNAWLAGHKYTGIPAEKAFGRVPFWSNDELYLVRLYLESLPSGEWRLQDYDILINYLFQRYMPHKEMISEAEWFAVRSHLLGKVQAKLESVTPDEALVIVNSLPTTVPGAVATFGIVDAEKSILEYCTLHSADNIVSMTESARHAVKATVLDHMKTAIISGENDTGKLEQSLNDRFSAMNRDWRRIAITESGNAANEGFIAAIPHFSKVKRVEIYNGACGFCRKIDGRIFEVVPADHPNKNGETQIWPGKTNIGRSSSPRKRMADGGLERRDPDELWWVASGTQHPHCRGRWTLVDETKSGGDPKFKAWFDNFVGNKIGFRVNEWAKNTISQ